MGYRIVNPYSIYILSFVAVIAVYQLDWSNYFPPLSFPLVLFFVLTFIVTGVIAFRILKRNKNVYARISINSRIAVKITLLIYLMWIVEFIYADGIPILNMLLGNAYDYRTFGVPTFHVVVVTFSSFYASYLFHGYLSTLNKTLLVLSIVNIAASVLIMNRGMLLQNVSACALIYFLNTENRKISWKVGFTFIGASILILIIFGVLGNFRLSNKIGRTYDRHLVFESGEAKQEVRNSWLPSEFFWVYFYASAPMANLQHNISYAEPDYNVENFLLLINNELIPDAIAKRIDSTLGYLHRSRLQVADHLNVATYYGGGYYYYGWVGLFILFGAVLIIPAAGRFKIIRESKYHITFLGVLCSLYLFLVFDNSFVFTGFSFQLAYPILFAFIDRIRQSKEQ